MNRKAFLLGFFSIGGQVLLLRELIASFNGDELLIGTALFGWLIAVAGGAGLGGIRKIKIKALPLFIIGAILLPSSIITARLGPLFAISVPGEVVPFSTAALLSIAAMIPVGVISGWLFTAITREGHRPAKSIVQVYLLEGIGAFIGGVAIAALVGIVYSTLAMAFALGVVMLTLYLMPVGNRKIYIILPTLLAILVVIKMIIPTLDIYLDRTKYDSFRIEKSFDTHYGHQAILSRNEMITLMTDNAAEASYPNLLQAESCLLPPFLYKPDSKNVLYIGRAEFGVMQLADSLTGVKLTALDPRKELSEAINQFIPPVAGLNRIDDDQLSYFLKHQIISKYDIIILNPGEPDNNKVSRLLTAEFLNQTKGSLEDHGILFYPAPYDTDRYISPEKSILLAALYNTFKRAFNYVILWPGETTLFFAFDDSLLNISSEQAILNSDSLSYKPQYINSIYLPDRLEELKIARLEKALQASLRANTLNRPIIPYYQAVYRSTADGLDRKLIPFILGNPQFMIILPALILALLLILIMRRRRRRAFGLFLYFIAGLVSLSLELISFYIFQSTSGSLYSEMAILIGSFMIGLALGTYYSLRINKENLEYPALLLMLTAIVVYYATYNSIGTSFALIYQICFLLTMAMATGSLFVAATDRYYYGKSESNRGLGYALEIIGSAIGALTAVTILLPLIGLQWLLISFIILLVISLIGAIITA
ncbi:MAG: hypothetical protein CVT49_12815 [candidate division Zixibacteria bacterium HGW-Zixibacteria-1]|nr:MAG: hypothetical protein CVT49_12815 [candidate division Zixibacteria bacterium HGW-Zixibacteria-1]